MTDTTDIKALREASRRDTFEHQAAQYEKCSLSFIVSLRNKEGGYSNEKIDDMWCGFKLAVAPPWGRTVGEVAIESNRLFHEKKSLLDQLEAERQRADDAERANRQQKRDLESGQTVNKVLQAELAALKGDQVPVVSELIPEGMKYSSALPEFVGDSNEISSYRCWIHGNTRKVATQEQAYADAKAVCELFTAQQKPVVLPTHEDCQSCDRHYVDGMKAGWNFHEKRDNQGFIDSIERVQKDMREARKGQVKNDA